MPHTQDDFEPAIENNFFYTEKEPPTKSHGLCSASLQVDTTYKELLGRLRKDRLFLTLKNLFQL
jgi:hypothetical protein